MYVPYRIVLPTLVGYGSSHLDLIPRPEAQQRASIAD